MWNKSYNHALDFYNDKWRRMMVSYHQTKYDDHGKGAAAMHRRFFSVVLVLLFAAGLYAQAAAGEAPGGATETAQSAA